MENVEIGRRIGVRRRELDIPVTEIAARTGLSKATIHRYESGDIKNIKLPVIETIATILNVNPAWLVGKSHIKEPTGNIGVLDHLAVVERYVRTVAVFDEAQRALVLSALQVARGILENNKEGE